MSMKSLLLLFILPGMAFTGCDGGADKTDSKPGVKDSTETVSPPVNNFTMLELSQEGIHSAALTSNEKYSYFLVLNGGDPYVFTKPLSASIPSERKILEFEYKTDKEINDLQIFYALGGAPSEALSKNTAHWQPLRATVPLQQTSALSVPRAGGRLATSFG